MKKMMHWVLATIFCIHCITISAAYSNNDNPSDSSEKELRIAIAWRADTDNEFVTATTTVSGIDMIEGIERTDKACAIGIQFHPEAAIVKHIGKGLNNANASQFMTYDAALPLFRAFIGECKSNE